MECLEAARAALQDEHTEPAALAQPLNMQAEKCAAGLAESLSEGAVAVVFTVLHPASADRSISRALDDPGVLALVVRAQDPTISGCLIKEGAALKFCKAIQALKALGSAADRSATSSSDLHVVDSLNEAEMLLKLPSDEVRMAAEGTAQHARALGIWHSLYSTFSASKLPFLAAASRVACGIWQQLSQLVGRGEIHSKPQPSSHETSSQVQAALTAAQQRAGVLKALYSFLIEPLILKELIPQQATQIVFVPDQVNITLDLCILNTPNRWRVA